MTPPRAKGWAGFRSSAAPPGAQGGEPTPIDRLFASVFGDADGMRVLAILREDTIERSGACLDDRALAALEAKRQIVREIERRVAAGRKIEPAQLRRELPMVSGDE